MKLFKHTFLLLLVALAGPTAARAQDPLPSWNDGPAKQAIVSFVHATTDQASPLLVPPAQRIATFDQDGTLWVEHPMYTQVMYCLERVPALVKKKVELKLVEPFKTVLSGNHKAVAKLSLKDLEKIFAATHSGMSVDEYRADVETVARHCQGPALETAVYGTHLPAHAGNPALPSRQRLQDLHRHR